MALTNYAELKSSIADFLNRDDLTSVIPTFISLAEAQFARDLRHYKMENRATGTIDSQFMTKPGDWLQTIRINITTSNTRPLDLLSAQAMVDKRANHLDVTGIPRYYRHSENQFEFFPTPDGSYGVELLYYQRVPALSDSETTNWLLTEAPDAYLYGSLLHSAPYLSDDQRTAVWAQLFGAAVQRLNQSSDEATHSGSGLVMRNRGLA
jgi:hypothetical protein